ncbi:Fur family transcriptional regulator [Dethiothermospora halolimnae]|uniref:Fur family transcriptional regulator n=1 Tax=Dethiothermospora halolimnae TaxID=3114390 RepID=UPI003CCBB71A
MRNAVEKFTLELNKRGLRPSHQRIKILEYLTNNPCHPTAEKILSEMKKELPTLSKSTVYKTLNAFVEAQMLREITIENNEVRYEYNLIDHGHFKCEKCGLVYDFKIDFDILQFEELKGFKINDKNIYFKGVCKNCLTKDI